MGAAASINNRDELAILTAIELGDKISALGEEYVAYKELFVANNLDGATVSSLSKDDQIQKLKDIGVTNETHISVLILEFENIKVAEPTEPAPAEPDATAELAPAPTELVGGESKDGEVAVPTETSPPVEEAQQETVTPQEIPAN